MESEYVTLFPELDAPPQMIRLLDVTLRDGGYLNDWAYSPAEMCDLVRLLDTRGVDYIEVGYIDDDPDPGLAARCPADLLERLHGYRSNARFAAMLRATAERPREVLESRRGFLDLIRIPTHAVRVGASLEVAEIVRDLGLECSINLTNVSIYTEAEILGAVDAIRDAGCVSMIYLADSRGALAPGDVRRVVGAVRERWDGPLGFHAHDNLGNAFANAIEALNRGCRLVDGSVNGFGQGVGNAPLQELLRVLGRPEPGERDSLAGFANGLAMPEWGRLQDVYRLTGQKNVSQDWVPGLDRLFGRRLPGLLRTIPRGSYHDEDEFRGILQRAGRTRLHNG